jgi:hypothetical protein
MDVHLGHVADDSIAPTLYVLVLHGATRRPELAAEMLGSVLLRFDDGYAPIRIDFRGDEIHVADDEDHADVARDLEVRGRMGDVTALIASPLAGGLPKPTSRRGRLAIARLADGRVEFDGPLAMGRKLLRLLQVEVPAPKKRGRVNQSV